MTTPSKTSSGRHLMDGTLRMFLANMLLPVTGLVTAAYLTRRLGADGYGLLVLATTFAVFVELTLNAFLSRASIKFVGEAADWKPVGATVLRLHLIVGAASGLLIAGTAIPLAALMDTPALAWCLVLYALQIPVSSLSLGHQNVLLGTGQYRARAMTNACRWLARLVLILLLVEMGLSVHGAILGGVGAALAELLLARRFVKLPFFGRPTVAIRPFVELGLVLGVFSLLMQAFSNMGVVFLKTLGGSLEAVGLYGAAQNLAIVPALFGVALSPMLLSTVSRQLSNGELEAAKEMGRGAVRAVFALLPYGALVAGAAPAIVTWIFGETFEPAAPVLALLFSGAIVFILISVAVSIATAEGVPRYAVYIGLLLVITGATAHLFLIPRFGATGAAAATVFGQLVGASAAMLVMNRIWSLKPPWATIVRSLFIAAAAYAAASMWPAKGLLMLVELAILGAAIPAAFALLREFSNEELAHLRAWLRD